jgi:ABC-type Fe3+/spermidine/putrescine transport system ATPase subunit
MTQARVAGIPAGALAIAPPLSAGAPLLEIRSVAKSFGSRSVLRSVSLAVARGEFLSILGETGSGKTTLLRLVAGFEQPDAGEIWMAGSRIDPLPPYRRRVNTVFQSYALFPHLSVFENIAYGLRVQGVRKAEIPERVEQALAMVKMGEFRGAAPARLSGGQQQRVALARALVNRPEVLLLDEPLSALDANLRRQVQAELKSLQRELGITFVFVTHDQDEAIALSDRIALLREGRVEQVATPREIYYRPSTIYTALFIGQTNLLRAQMAGGMARCGPLAWPASGPDGPAIFSLRPELVRLAADSPSSGAGSVPIRFRAKIVNQFFAGAATLVEILAGDDCPLRVRLPSGATPEGFAEFEFSPADAVRVADAEDR